MLTNNDILKKLRVALYLKDTDILDILKLADFEVSKTELSALFRAPEDERYMECGDQLLRRFLDGLIIKMRGPREEKAPQDPASGTSKAPESRGPKPKSYPKTGPKPKV